VLGTGGVWSQPAWSPNGADLAYVYRGINFSDIFVTDVQGQTQTRLTASQSTILDDNDWNFRPAWSPDGRQIAFVSDKDSTFPVVWLMNADGSGRRPLLTPGLPEEAVDAIAWSPDGSQLAVSLFNEPGPTQIALVPLSPTGHQTGRVVTNQSRGALDPAWSPDGAWLTYVGRDSLGMDLFAERPDGSGQQRLTNDGASVRAPAWSPDGRHIAFLASRTGWFEVWVLDVQPGAAGGLLVSNERQLTQDLHVDAASGLSWGR
jgi:TolB protein